MNTLPQRTVWCLSVAINLVLVSCVWLFLEPILDSKDDFFLLYLLSGAWGNAPTDLLHYQYGLNPLLTQPLAWLFTVKPGTNWYSLLLLGSMFGGGIVLAAVLVLQQGIKRGLLLYAAFFTTILFWLLLRINFSAAAIVLSMAAVALLYAQAARGGRWWHYIPAVLLLLLATLLRMHTVAAVLLVTAPLCLTFDIKKLRQQVLPVLGSTVVLAVTLHIWQVRYYQQHIPGWKQENEYREALFGLVNRPFAPNDSMQAHEPAAVQIAAKQFFIDSAFTNKKVLQRLAQHRNMQREIVWNKAPTILYWIAAENKWPLLFVVVLAIWIMGAAGHKQQITTVFSIALCISLIIVLRFWFKLPPYLLLSLLGSTIVVLLLQLPQQISKQAQKWLALLLAAVLLGGCISQLRSSKQLLQRAGAWEAGLRNLASDTSHIFLLLDQSLPLSDFPARKAPANYPLPHVLIQAHFINGQANRFFERNQLAPDSWWRHPRLRIYMHNSTSAMQQQAILAKYLYEKWGARVSLSPAMPQFAPHIVKALQWQDETAAPERSRNK